MKIEEEFLSTLAQDGQLTTEKIASLLIPLMGAIYSKQQLSVLEGSSIELSDAFKAVVKDILSLSSEVIELEKSLQNQSRSQQQSPLN